MAKHSTKEKYYSEAELILTFGLTRVPNGNTDLMREWLDTPNISLKNDEQILFDKILHEAQQKIEGWHEEALKMKFIAFVLALGQMEDGQNYNTYFEETISATVEGNYLKTKTDFMIAKGVLDLPITPFFHFQEWKKHKDPNGDPVAQLLEAFLIAQEINKNNKPLYGCTISGKYWDFFTIQDKTYCISKTYDCTDSVELLQIISILRKFKDILHTKLLD
jgi:hypothetical protein